jgi:hypothetical protein
LGFNRDEVSQLLVEVKRRCCICYRFCGCKIETDHIVPGAECGTDEIDNAIPVCFECHAEIHSYNDSHPRGRKFLPEELRAHKEKWLQVCRDHPEILVASSRTADVGPLQALIDELEYNKVVCGHIDNRGALFGDEQFRRATAHGAIATLEPGLKQAILEAYAAMSRANQRILAEMSIDPYREGIARVDAAIKAVNEATQQVTLAHDHLLSFLKSE